MIERPIRFIRAFGIALIVLGIVALLAQVFQLNLGGLIWPFFIIVPGVLLFTFGLALEGSPGEPIAMLSGIVTMVGLLLLYQSITGHWASWAYAWVLIAPTGVGVAQMLYGGLKDHPSAIKSGGVLVKIGMIMFVTGLVFFELILNISGLGLSFIGWPLLFIGLGVYVLLRGVLQRRR
jgi:hypothetical protein